VSNPQEIRILLADDHALLREGLANMLESEPGLSVVGQAGDGQEAVEMTLDLGPDIVLMDVKMPQMEASRPRATSRPASRISASFCSPCSTATSTCSTPSAPEWTAT